MKHPIEKRNNCVHCGKPVQPSRPNDKHCARTACLKGRAEFGEWENVKLCNRFLLRGVGEQHRHLSKTKNVTFS